MNPWVEETQRRIERFCEIFFSALKGNEKGSVYLHAESSDFLRFNQTKLRQAGHVDQQTLTLRFDQDNLTVQKQTELGALEEIPEQVRSLLEELRRMAPVLGPDPFHVPIQGGEQSQAQYPGRPPSLDSLVEELKSEYSHLDLAGIYVGGPVLIASANSEGQRHFFATENFYLDYSLFRGPKAVKGLYADSEWQASRWRQQLREKEEHLRWLERPAKKLKPGAYSTYLAPAATNEILSILSWEGVSFGALKRGRCPLQALANGERKLSPQFSLRENFSLGFAPPFNDLGEVSAPQVSIIEKGSLKELLVSSRSASEYGVQSNAAGTSESLRSPEILPGDLEEDSILSRLGEGLYLSNLHYLNYSDRLNGRFTGMTRYACFWVENGEIVAPIEDLRFDESLYHCFGDGLEALTANTETSVATGTYGARDIGGSRLPGLLVRDFKFTL